MMDHLTIISIIFCAFITHGVVLVISEENVSNNKFSDLIKSSPYYGILTEARLERESSLIIKTDCVKEVRLLLDGIDQREVWALKSFDASGQPSSGFIYGQNFWYGSRKQCERINAPMRISVSNRANKKVDPKIPTEVSPMHMQYVMIYANYSTVNQFDFLSYVQVPLEIGICVPRSCSLKELHKFGDNYFHKNISTIQNIYNISIKLIEVKTLSMNRFFARTDVLLIACSILCLVGIIFLINCIPVRSEGTLLLLKRCFSLKENYENLMSFKMSDNAIHSINGLRTITCFLICGMHFAYFMLFTATNQAEAGFAVFNIGAQIFFFVIIYVDTFFVASGFLLVYNFLLKEEEMKKIQQCGFYENAKLFLKMILHRYFRLTPAIILATAGSHLVAVYLKENSTYFIDTNMDLYCPNNYWWRNLLYIQSYFPIEEMCGTWTWYLSNDMNYFLICLTGLFIYAKKPKLAKFLFIVLSIISVVLTYYIHHKINFAMNLDELMETKDQYYSPPYVRMNPYLGGMLAGYYLYKWRDTKVTIKPFIEYIWILLSIGAILLAFLAVNFKEIVPNIVWHIEQSFGRYFVGLLIGATIIICHCGHGGFFGRIVTHKIFFHINKLTYMIYLINPIVISFCVGTKESPTELDNMSILIFGIGMTFTCYLLSIILTLFFEIPFVRLSSAFLMKKR